MYRNLSSLSTSVNEVVRIADPVFHGHQQLLRKAVEEAHPIATCMNAIDPLLFEGREILFNRRSGVHRDSQDPQLAYAGLFAAGNFTEGGELELPDLKLTLRLKPGDFVLIRGRVLQHGIRDWDGGQRICIPHFTHTSLWRDRSLEGLVSIPATI